MNARMSMIVAAAVVALAAFLPWASFLGYSKTGVDGDGALTLVIALAGLLLIWRGWLGWIGQAVAAGLVAAVGIYDLNDAGNLAAIGLYLTFFAGVAWFIAALMWRKSTRSTVGG
jgi:hypothetical protein